MAFPIADASLETHDVLGTSPGHAESPVGPLPLCLVPDCLVSGIPFPSARHCIVLSAWKAKTKKWSSSYELKGLLEFGLSEADFRGGVPVFGI